MTNMTNREKRNLRRVSMLVTAQTLGNLEKLATMAGYGHDLGRVVDKLTRDRMVELHTIKPHKGREKV